MDPAETIVLPAPVAPLQRAPLPLLAAVVPVVSGVVLFAVTGSPLSLCFAALGPVMILASFLDGARQRRRAARRARAEEDEAWERVEEIVVARAEAEVARLRRATPDVAGCLAEPPLRRTALAEDAVVAIGRGDGASPLRFSGSGERAERFRAQHGTLPGVPVTAPLQAGVCLRGPEPIVAAVARAMVLQLCLRHANGAIRLEGDGIARIGLAALPQARRHGHGASPVHVGAERTATVGARLALVGPAAPPPPGFDTVIDVCDPGTAEVRTPDGGLLCAAEGVSETQAAALVQGFVDEQEGTAELPAAVALADVLGVHDRGVREELAVAVGRDAEGAVLVDLVGDGPHALVTGVTGAGKSELLISWVTALAAAHPAERLSFVLADFKGGTAFEPLRALPHVAAVITDLDAEGAARGVRSLRAELRRREGILAGHGARSIAEAEGVLARLVIVVDEFAALVQEHPDLASVFTDIAARGRALGLHLILGTQRATGVIRDALATNCPLRIALRVTDPADSRAMIGTEEAASLPGDAAGRGLALLRRPQDIAPAVFRVARTAPEDLVAVVARSAGQAQARSPWLPALPLRLSRPRSSVAGVPAAVGEVVLGLADEPDRQRQTWRTLRVGQERGLTIFGGPGSGKSTALRAIAEQVPQALLLPHDPEQSWSLIDAIAEGRRAMPPLLVVDDVDRHLAAFPIEYATAWAERLQRVIRAAGAHGGTVLLSAARCSGPVAALADLLPARAILRTASRTEHLACGGEPAAFDAGRPPGRGVLDGTELQFALPTEAERAAAGSAENEPAQDRRRRSRSAAEAGTGRTPLWQPRAALVGVVSTTPTRTRETLAARFGEDAVHLLGDAAAVLPEVAPGAPERGARILLVGDSDTWQRQYALWQRISRGGEIVVLAEAARELRTLAGVRELAPYALPFAGRAWTIDPDGRPSRVLLPGAAAQSGIPMQSGTPGEGGVPPRVAISPAARPGE
jgi:S-DNA-T family DNA segregation ATPase FtsK/SpoIIIE